MIREGKSLSGNERNVVFLNVGNEGKRFVEVSSASGFDSPGDGRGLGIVDWDGDGDLDVWVSNRTAPTIEFYENQIGQEHNFVAFELEGTAPDCNRDAIGSRVEVVVDGKRLIRGLRAGDGFRSQSSKRVHFGVGAADEIEKVTIRWADGEREEFSGVSTGKVFRMVQGTGKAEFKEVSKFSIPKTQAPEPSLPREFARLPHPPVFPEITFESGTKEQPCLIVLWQPECDDCREELVELTRRKNQLEEMGLKVLAVTADGEGRKAKAEAILEETGFPFESGYLDEKTIERILVLHRHLFYQPYHLQVPTSFLLTAEGRLSGVFRGGLDWVEISDQVNALKSNAPLKPILSGTFLGRSDLSRPAVLIKAYLDRGMTGEAERVFRFDQTHLTIKNQKGDILRSIGESYLFRKELADAERLFHEALEVNKSDARVLNQLGVVQFAKRDLPGAMKFWRQAHEADDSAPEPLMNLGKNLLREGKTNEAMLLLERYHELEPEDADGHNYLAIAYLRTSQFATAQTHLQKLIKLRPNDGVAYLNLAKVHLHFKEPKRARMVLSSGLERDDLQPKVQEQMAQLLDRLGR